MIASLSQTYVTFRLLFCGSHSRREPKSTMHIQTRNSRDGTYRGRIRARCMSFSCQLDSRQTPHRLRPLAKYKFQYGLRTLLFIRPSAFRCLKYRFIHDHDSDWAEFNIPSAFGSRVRNALKAEPCSVRLSNLVGAGNLWYGFGRTIMDMCACIPQFFSAKQLIFSQSQRRTSK